MKTDIKSTIKQACVCVCVYREIHTQIQTRSNRSPILTHIHGSIQTPNNIRRLLRNSIQTSLQMRSRNYRQYTRIDNPQIPDTIHLQIGADAAPEGLGHHGT